MGVFVQMNGDSLKASSQPVGYIIQENGCWGWVGANNGRGYGIFSARNPVTGKKEKWYAHRWLYTQHKGSIPVGLEIDHLCRNPGCCNPDHLEVVTPKENFLRGSHLSAQTRRTKVCKRGHHVRGHNLYRSPNGKGQCRKCMDLHEAKRVIRKRKRKMVVGAQNIGGNWHHSVQYTLECGHTTTRRPRGERYFKRLGCSTCPQTSRHKQKEIV